MTMFRFTIRDVLWLTVVVAMAACWYIERSASARQRQQSAQREAELVAGIEKLKLDLDDQHGQLMEAARQNGMNYRVIKEYRRRLGIPSPPIGPAILKVPEMPSQPKPLPSDET